MTNTTALDKIIGVLEDEYTLDEISEALELNIVYPDRDRFIVKIMNWITVEEAIQLHIDAGNKELVLDCAFQNVNLDEMLKALRDYFEIEPIDLLTEIEEIDTANKLETIKFLIEHANDINIDELEDIVKNKNRIVKQI